MTTKDIDTIIFQDVENYLWWRSDFRFLGTNRFNSSEILIRLIDNRTFGYYYRGIDENAGYYVRITGHVDGKRVYINSVYHADYIHSVFTTKTINKYVSECLHSL